MKYTKKDISKVDWKDFDKYINKIENEIRNYLKKGNLHIDTIIPILRGGGIPALTLSYKFNVLNIVPIQYKYLKEERVKLIKLLPANYKKLKKSKVILIVEGNHSSGKIANNVVSEIKSKLKNPKIIYVSLTKDFFYKDSVKADFTTQGYLTNENRNLSKEECRRKKIPFSKVFIFPWESKKEELAELNERKYPYVK